MPNNAFPFDLNNSPFEGWKDSPKDAFNLVHYLHFKRERFEQIPTNATPSIDSRSNFEFWSF